MLVIADGDDLEDRVQLAMALLATIIVAAALLEHRDLVALGLGDDLGGGGQAVRRLDIRPLAGEQVIAQRDLVTGIAVKLLDDDLVSGGDAILLAARAHDCEHWLFSSRSASRLRAVARSKTPAARGSAPPMAGGRGCQPC